MNNRVSRVRSVITDFDRTLTILFDQQETKAIGLDLEALYKSRGLPVHQFHGQNPYTLWPSMYRWMRLHAADIADSVNDEIVARLTEHEVRAAQRSRLLPGTKPALEWFKKSGIPVAIVSTNAVSAIRANLALNRVSNLVAAIVGRNSHKVSMDTMKPNPAPIYEALDLIGGGPAVIVGDSFSDIEAGKAAGIITIGVETGERPRTALMRAGADLVIHSFGVLPDLLKSRRI